MIDGPLGINPLYFSLSLFGLLLLFVLYLILPRGVRVGYFNSYPKRYTWSAKPRRRPRPVSSQKKRVPGKGTVNKFENIRQ